MSSLHQSLPPMRLVETKTGLRVHRSDVDAAIAAVLFVDGAEAYRGSHQSKVLRGMSYCTVLMHGDGYVAVGVSTDRESALRHAMNNAERRLRWMQRRALRLAALEGAGMPEANAAREDAATAVGVTSLHKHMGRQNQMPIQSNAE